MIRRFSLKRPVLSLALAWCVAVPTPANAATDAVRVAGDVLAFALPAGAYGATFAAHDPHGRPPFYKSLATGMGITFVLKETVREERPDHSDDRSFPSGHAAAAFEGAAFIQRRYGWDYAVPAYLAAVFVGYSRVASDRHYMRDVIAGGLIGLLSSYAYTHAQPRANGIVTPTASPGGVGIRFATAW